MSQPTPQLSPSPDAPAHAGHEPDRGSKRALAIFVATLIVCAVAVHFGIAWLLHREGERTRQADVPLSIVHEPPSAPADAPPLQPSQTHDRTPAMDLAAMRAAEDRVFTDLGWTIDPATDAARPPDDLVARVAETTRSRKIASPATAPATQAHVVTPVAGSDEGAAR